MANRAVLDLPDPESQLALFGNVPAVSAPVRAEPVVAGSHGSNGHYLRLTLGEAARIIREAVKDKSYRKTPLGQLVGRYLRWFRNEYGATESTIRDYEAILARMSLLLADREPLEVSTEDLREVIDTWAMRHARTRAKVTSVIRAFWVWAEEEGHVPFSPASTTSSTRRSARRTVASTGPTRRSHARRTRSIAGGTACSSKRVSSGTASAPASTCTAPGTPSRRNCAAYPVSRPRRRHSDTATSPPRSASTATRISATFERAMDAFAEAREAEEAASRGNDSPSRLD